MLHNIYIFVMKNVELSKSGDLHTKCMPKIERQNTPSTIYIEPPFFA